MRPRGSRLRALWRLAVTLALLALAVRPRYALAAGEANVLIVSPGGPFTSLAAALAAAKSGDTVEVHAGTYPGPVVVETPGLALQGIDWPVLDGGEHGTVVTLAAPGVVMRGFQVRGSGVEPDRDHGGITLTAPGITVENNRLSDVLFGIFIAHADGAVVRGNDVTSKAEFALGRKGDGIRLWYSQDVTVEANTVHAARDVVAWYASGFTLRGNTIRDGRYGIHLMYCDRARIERNTFSHNSVGIYTMYSNDVVIAGNDLRGQRGPSGYALGFKDADRLTVTGNVLADNRAGVYLDGTPFSPDGYARFERNILAFNDVGVMALPAVHGNTFSGNTFWENEEQVAVQGGGKLAPNDWRGNYWSDYAGFDAGGAAGGQPDGVGDVPYLSERFFEGLMDREPMLRALLHSPAVDALELAATAFPIVRPQPKLSDPAPLIAPAVLPDWSSRPAGEDTAVGLAALGLILASLAVGGLALEQGGQSMRASIEGASSSAPAPRTTGAARGQTEATVRALGVGKRYGRVQALDGVSFEARPGEALALWGANGAGKTTLLKAMLGLIEFKGQIEIAGHDVRRAGKLARRSVGYVPQEATFYDQSVLATMAFYARLKQVPAARTPALLDRLGLAPHARKPVPALSGGLKQRLALAVALLAEPAVLLLDEPTANLDAQAQHDYLKLLRDLRLEERKTILFASHRLEEVEAIASRVLVLELGRLVNVVTPLELLGQLLPQIELTLWVPEAQRPDALSALQQAGWPAHFNGRGTVVVQVAAEHKLRPLQTLQAQGIAVQDFEMTRGAAWN